MSNEKEEYFCSAMVVLFWSIIALTIFFLGYSFIYYSDIDLASKISSGFSFVSSLSIFVTIIIYFMQKKSDDEKQRTRDEIVKRNLNIALSSHKTTILNILKFIEDDFEENYKSIMTEKGKYNSLALIALGVDNQVIQYQSVHVVHGEFIKESMKERHSCSSTTAQLVEEINHFSRKFTKFINFAVIDKLSRDNFPIRTKINIIKNFKESEANRFMSEITRLRDRI
ncbi:TPA: hypothetical protein ACRR5U_001171 [Morganella morganii]